MSVSDSSVGRPSGRPAPRLSIVIPTYNRAGLLRASLDCLVAQSLPAGEFEVVVADDGSTDETAAVVQSFAGRLRLKYHFQEDLGFRAAAARNAGARLAGAPLLAFLDSGVRPGPGFAAAHLRAHAGAGPRGRAVIGWAHAYPIMFNSGTDSGWLTGLAGALDELPPEEVVARYCDDPAFRDSRYDELRKVDFDLARRTFPEELFWTANCSVPAGDFWAVGGFDESYRGWGMEDLDLGFRLARHGVEFHFSGDAWAIESPHDRDEAGNLRSLIDNAVAFIAKYEFCIPALEMFWLTTMRPGGKFGMAEEANLAVARWARECRGLDVSEELERAFASVPAGARVAVFGCGAPVPPTVSARLLADFDPEVVQRLHAAGHNDVRNNVGVRLALQNRDVDVVIITSRLRGLWERFGEPILAEANRIGAETMRLFPAPGPPDVP